MFRNTTNHEAPGPFPSSGNQPCHPTTTTLHHEEPKILRVETRTLQILTTTRGIGFPYAKQVVRITRERVVTATGKRGVEVVYAICSLPFEQARPATIATWLRQHWGIENSLHWVRDVTYDGDRSTTHIGNGAQFMASLRNTAINRRRLDGATNIAEACRATALTVNRRLDLLSPRNPSSAHNLLINYAGTPVSKGFRADTIT